MLERQARASRIAVIVALGIVLVWGGVTEVATAALITFNFEGKVTYVSPNLSSEFSTSDKFVGSYSFHSDASNHAPSSDMLSVYSLNNLSYTLGGKAYTVTSNPVILDGPAILIQKNIFIDLGENIPPLSYDEYRVTSEMADPIHPFHWMFFASTYEPNTFSDLALPLLPPSLGHANLLTQGWQIDINDSRLPGIAGTVSGELTSLTLAPVPVPGALLLFGSGFLGLAAFKRLCRTRQA